VPSALDHGSLLDDLNEAQRAAVTHGDGPVLVLAGAGTGKTRVLTRRIAWLIASRKAAPSEVLGLTFTEKAAQEMEERVDRLVPFGYADTTLLTFHAFGHRLLSEFGMLLGLPGEPRLLNESEAVVFLREHIYALPLDRLRPAGDPTKHLHELVKHFGRLADEDIAPDAYAAFAARATAEAHARGDAAGAETAALMTELAACQRAYLELLASEGLTDFAGLLSLSLRLVREHPALASELRRRYPWILVDEFQDTNFAQFAIVRAIAGETANLTVVGDDDQSIYKFRGAAISNILEFRERYPTCATYVLTENFRSTQPILDSAYKLIRHNDPDRLEVKAAVSKRLVARGPHPSGPPVGAQGFDTPSTEADFVATRIKTLVDGGKRRYGDIAVLVRRHAASDPIARALNLAGVPCRVAGGGGLYDRPEILACLDALTALADPSADAALFFLAASEIYDVPPLALAELRSRAERRHARLESAMAAALAVPPGAPDDALDPPAREALTRLLGDLAALRPFAMRHATGETLYRFLAHTGWLERLTTEGASTDPAADAKVQNLARLFDLARGFAQLAPRDRAVEFVRHIALLREAGDDPRAAEPDPDEDAVHVLTVHRAKGLEFPVVFLVGLEGGHFPGASRSDRLPFPDALLQQPPPGGDFHRKEERRLFYVGMTRAQEELWLTWATDHAGARRWKASPFVLEALDQAHVDAPLERARSVDQVHRHRKAPESAPLALEPIPGEQTLELSNRQIDDWLTCPLRYKYAHVLKVPLLPHHSVGYGLALHNAIREYYVHRREGWPIDVERMVAVFEQSWTGEGFITREHEQQRLEQGKAAVRAWFAREQESPSSPTMIEAPFRVTLGADVLRGRFDRVDVRPGLGPVIVDFKSSAVDDAEKADKRAEESLQLKLYALAYGLSHGKTPGAVELQFIESGVVGRAAVSEETLAEARASIAGASAGIRARAFEATPGYLECGYCAYNAICPAKSRGPQG
jgi:DNA helicase-2/ATP-dependent DNA helicase PcrA